MGTDRGGVLRGEKVCVLCCDPTTGLPTEESPTSEDPTEDSLIHLDE